ncbi:DNA-binding domain-containing protein, AraC-type [Opitutaceae bacterium TAV1]|nr:DNA-binding domain-containing protein, AraC-type [Opitutaceae bacterium TAV1]
MTRFCTTCCDREALEKAAGRVLFGLAACRRIGWRGAVVVAGEGGRGGSGSERETGREGRVSGDATVRQVVWLRGQVTFGTMRLEPGSVWRPGVTDRFGREEEKAAERAGASGLEFTFAGPLAADYVNFLEENFGRMVRLPPGSPALRAARALAAAAEAGARREVMSRRVFGWLAALHETLEERQVHLQDLLRGRIDHLLPEGAAHGYSVKALAAHLGCTPGWLARRLQQAWRRPAGEVLHALRLQHARELLATTGAGAGEVAWRCGFASASSFSKAFRRAMGMTPTQARVLGKKGTGGRGTKAGGNAIMRVMEERRRRGPTELRVLPAGEDVMAATVWGGAYFQCDGGETDKAYNMPFDISINKITRGIHWVVTLEGEAVFETGGYSLTVHPGMVVVYSSPSKGRWMTPSGRPWRRVWVKVRCDWGNEALLALGTAHGWAAMVPLASRPVRLARQCVREWNEHRNRPSVEMSRSGYEWLLAWWELLHSGRVRPLVDARGQAVLPDMREVALPSFFRRIKTITGYAKQIGYSRSHTMRKLSEQWKGGTPAQIIRRQRLAQAALDLRRTRLPVVEIARRSQFASAGSFIPAFRREFGMTPLAYRLAQI